MTPCSHHRSGRLPALTLVAFVLTACLASADPPAGDAWGILGADAAVGFPAGAFDWSSHPALAQQDTLWLPSPRGALFRSLALPGWGQLYNRQYVKAPVALAIVGGLVGATVFSNNRTILFRRAAIYDDCLQRPDDVPPGTCNGFQQYEAEFVRADELTAGALTAASARSLRDQYRRQRDLLALVSFLAYGLQALDAYVAAELADFDVGEGLDLRVVPQHGGAAFHLRVSF